MSILFLNQNFDAFELKILSNYKVVTQKNPLQVTCGVFIFLSILKKLVKDGGLNTIAI